MPGCAIANRLAPSPSASCAPRAVVAVDEFLGGPLELHGGIIRGRRRIYPWLLVGYGSCKTAEPVSSRDFRLDTTFGQPPDTAAMNCEGSRSMVWVIESLTTDSIGSS